MRLPAVETLASTDVVGGVEAARRDGPHRLLAVNAGRIQAVVAIRSPG